jgi:hypothetical protein
MRQSSGESGSARRCLGWVYAGSWIWISENSVKKLSEKSGAGSNQYLIKRRKWLDRAPFWRFALPQSHHEGFFDYFSDSFTAKFAEFPYCALG